MVWYKAQTEQRYLELELLSRSWVCNLLAWGFFLALIVVRAVSFIGQRSLIWPWTCVFYVFLKRKVIMVLSKIICTLKIMHTDAHHIIYSRTNAAQFEKFTTTIQYNCTVYIVQLYSSSCFIAFLVRYSINSKRLLNTIQWEIVHPLCHVMVHMIWSLTCSLSSTDQRFIQPLQFCEFQPYIVFYTRQTLINEGFLQLYRKHIIAWVWVFIVVSIV